MPPMWPLVGRREELDFIEQVLDRPEVAGMVLAGEPGIGKTRLVAEVLQMASSKGLVTEFATSTHAASHIPFGAIAHLLPATLRSGPARFNLLRVAADALLSERDGRRLVLGIDDAHLLDDHTAALLHHIAVTNKAFVVLSIRAGEAAPDSIADIWKSGVAEHIEVQALSRDEADGLVEEVLGSQVEGATLHRLWEKTRGNPLFLNELLLSGRGSGSLVEDGEVWRWQGDLTVGPRLIEAVEARVGELDETERLALEAVAAAEWIGVPLLAPLVEQHAIDSLERKGILEVIVSGRRLRVRPAHPLYGEAVRGKTPSLRANSIRRDLADSLEATGARRREDLLRLATWRLDAAGEMDATMMVAAARKAGEVFDFALAERLALAAERTGGAFDASQALAEALIGRGKFAEAEELLGAVARSGDAEEQRVGSAIARADNLFWRLGKAAEAERVIAEAEEKVVSDRLRNELSAARVGLSLFGGQVRKAIELAEAILSHPNVSETAKVHVAMAATWGAGLLGRIARAKEIADLYMEPATSVADKHPFARDWLRSNRMAACLFEGSLDKAASGVAALYREAASHDAEWIQPVWAWVLGWITRTKGKPQTARRLLREGASLLRSLDMFRHLPLCLGDLAQCHALLGDTEAAEKALNEAEKARLASLKLDVYHIGMGRAWTAAAKGEVTAGIDIALKVATETREMDQVLYEAMALHDVARMGEPGSALGRLEKLALGFEGKLIPAFAAHARALAARDAARLERVSLEFEDMGAMLFAAEASAAACSVHRSAGRIASGFTASGRAGRLAAACEGARTPQLEASAEPLPLTRREREVATLAANGLCSREIAERLVVSVRTIDNHLHNAYSKLGVTGREELAPIVISFGFESFAVQKVE